MLYHRLQMGRFLLGVLLPGVFQLWYKCTYFGDPLFQPYGSFFGPHPSWRGLVGFSLAQAVDFSSILLSYYAPSWEWPSPGATIEIRSCEH